jgi:hypothetical protein
MWYHVQSERACATLAPLSKENPILRHHRTHLSGRINGVSWSAKFPGLYNGMLFRMNLETVHLSQRLSIPTYLTPCENACLVLNNSFSTSVKPWSGNLQELFSTCVVYFTMQMRLAVYLSFEIAIAQ